MMALVSSSIIDAGTLRIIFGQICVPPVLQSLLNCITFPPLYRYITIGGAVIVMLVIIFMVVIVL